MSEASSMNFSVSVPGKGKTNIGRMFTLERLVEWIKAQELDEHTTKSLIALASRYPSHALPLFKKNFNLMLQRARAMRKSDSEEPITKITENTPTIGNFSSLDAGLNQTWKGKSIEKINEETNEEEPSEDWQNDSFGVISTDDDPVNSESL
jgi:hypothetical protein